MERTIMNDDPMTRLAKDAGCKCCGAKGDVFYWLEYSIFPTRLVRKRHRDKEIAAIYCRSCYEKDSEFHLEVGGNTYSAPKVSCITPQEQLCIVCGGRPKELYGVVSSLLLMAGSGIENIPLAFLCSDCVEQHEVHFSA